jgi:DNA-directed RNA polymerase subunit RPC12/RpoP
MSLMVKYFCHNCNTTFKAVVQYPSQDLRYCPHCHSTDRKKVQHMGTLRWNKYEVTYTWDVDAFDHEEAIAKAKQRGFSDWDGQRSRRITT